MSLVWVLFGSDCDYYKGLRNEYATLELKEVMALKSSSTVEHCRMITWAILDNGRAYFDDVKIILDFRGPDPPRFTQSYLIDILRNVRYATLVDCSNFPEEWKRKVKNHKDNHGGQQQVVEGGAVISVGVSRAAFGQDMHLAWGNTPLVTMLVDTKDSMEGGGKATLSTPTRDPRRPIREDIPSKGDRQAPATGVLGETTNSTRKSRI
jgi:hypothetical protein